MNLVMFKMLERKVEEFLKEVMMPLLEDHNLMPIKDLKILYKVDLKEVQDFLLGKLYETTKIN